MTAETADATAPAVAVVCPSVRAAAIARAGNRRRWVAPFAAALLASLAACGSDDDSSPPTVAADWNGVAMTAWLQLEATAGAPITPHYEARSLAIANAVIHDVLNAVDRRSKPYAFDQRQADASPDAAEAQAAHDVLVAETNLVSDFPAGSQLAYLDGALSTDLAKVPDGAAKTAGIALGKAAAAYYLKLRAADAPNMVPFGPNPLGNGTTAGAYQYTVPFNSPGVPFNGGSIGVPLWKNLTPFVLTGTGQFVPPGPYAANSDAAAADLAEVKALGGTDSTTRTADQTAIAKFYSENSPLFWNRIARTVADAKALDGWQRARLYTMLQLSLADAYIVYSAVGQQFNHWRPVTAIHFTDPSSTWVALGFPNPPTQDYTSGHAMEGGAAVAVLQAFFGTDAVSFSTTSSSLAGASRSYTSFSQASDENALSRIYFGYHFRQSVVDGKALGASIGGYVAKTVLQPVS